MGGRDNGCGSGLLSYIPQTEQDSPPPDEYSDLLYSSILGL